MKRALKIVAGLVILLLVAAAVVIGDTFLGRRAVTDGVEIDGVRIVKDGIVSVAIVKVGPTQVVLIDDGNDAAGKAILAELSRRQLGPEAVTAILLTHGHPDHTAASALFPRAAIMALGPEVALVEGREGAHGPLTRLMPVKPTGVKVTRPLHDGETVALGDTLIRVFAVPGHTAGSAAYLAKGVLFVGDAADVARDGRIIGSPWIFSDSQADDRASLVRLDHRLVQEGVAVRAIACAHSGVLEEGLAPLNAFAEANQ